jgi:tripartite ATP-independent transporter DctP family solute receptor
LRTSPAQRTATSEERMKIFNRNPAWVFGILVLAGLIAAPPAVSQNKPKLRVSAVFVEQDIRAQAFKNFAAELKDEFDFELYFGATLFRQGTELVAVQRGNLEMANLAPQDLAKQIPAWSILTAAYLFRDAEHVKKVLSGEVGKELYKLADDQGVHVLGPVYFGTRHVNLKPKKKINAPQDLAGMKLRMPGGEAWQFLGKSLGANPTPMAFAETYTGLQSGAIDGQDNPLPNNKVMKFHEVTSQIVLTAHLVGFDVLAIQSKIWKALTQPQRDKLQGAVDKALDWSTAKHLEQERELVAFFKAEGLDVYTPDVEAFRRHAQKMYLESDFAKDWPKGMLDRINAVK